MTRAPWNNESRICRYPYDAGPMGPTKEEKLRKKYPDLQKKWEKYQRYQDIFIDIKWELGESFKKVSKNGRVIFNKKYVTARDNLKKAKKDYEFLKKMLWDY